MQESDALRPASPARMLRRLQYVGARKKILAARRFTDGADVHAAPVGVRGQYSVSAWIALSAEERSAYVRDLFMEQARGKAEARLEEDPPLRVRLYLALSAEDRALVDEWEGKASADVPFPSLGMNAVPASVEAPSPVVHVRRSALTDAPYLVACVGGCGTWLPATSRRPVVKYCGTTGAAQPPRPPRVEELHPSGSSAKPAGSQRSRKPRVRARCLPARTQ